MTLTGTVAYTIRPRRRSHLFARLMRNPLAVSALVVLVVIITLVVFADFFAPTDPNGIDLKATLESPSWQHPLGTDAAGRDIWSRTLHGGQLTLIGAVLVLAIALVVGVGAGLVAGYYAKWIDAGTAWLTALTMALPVMIVLLAVRAAFGPNLVVMMSTLGLLITPAFFLLVRSSVRGVRNELYVDAARVSGLSDARIISHHILSAIRAPLIIQSMVVASLAIGIQAALDFLGLGVASGPTWGGMLSEGFSQVYNAPQLMAWPALFLGATTAALLVLGNALRDTVEDRPRPKRQPKEPPVSNALPSEALLSVQDLHVSYATPNDGQREVVHGVSFELAHGKVLGLVGESGSGKSQIAFAILGLLPDAATITQGAALLDGTDLLKMDARTRRRHRVGGIAYIPQEPMANLDPCFTIGDQLTEPLRVVRGMSRKAAYDTAIALLDSVAIVDPAQTMRRYPHEISGGMAQRVLIAAALSLEPRVLIADEPTTALDVTVQSGVLALLRRLQRERNLSILLVTHDLGVAAELCDDIAVLQEGRIVEARSVDDVFYAPVSEHARSLLASSLAGADPRPPWSEPAARSVS